MITYPLFWFIDWAIKNRNADDERWMARRYYHYTTEKLFRELGI